MSVGQPMVDVNRYVSIICRECPAVVGPDTDWSPMDSDVMVRPWIMVCLDVFNIHVFYSSN